MTGINISKKKGQTVKHFEKIDPVVYKIQICQQNIKKRIFVLYKVNHEIRKPTHHEYVTRINEVDENEGDETV